MGIADDRVGLFWEFSLPWVSMGGQRDSMRMFPDCPRGFMLVPTVPAGYRTQLYRGLRYGLVSVMQPGLKFSVNMKQKLWNRVGRPTETFVGATGILAGISRRLPHCTMECRGRFVRPSEINREYLLYTVKHHGRQEHVRQWSSRENPPDQ